MDIYDFNQRDMEERAQLVWENGIPLAVRTEYNQTIALYHMGNFFAEVWYKPNPQPADLFTFFRSQSRLSFVQAFAYQNSLEPYLDLIVLPDV